MWPFFSGRRLRGRSPPIGERGEEGEEGERGRAPCGVMWWCGCQVHFALMDGPHTGGRRDTYKTTKSRITPPILTPPPPKKNSFGRLRRLTRPTTPSLGAMILEATYYEFEALVDAADPPSSDLGLNPTTLAVGVMENAAVGETEAGVEIPGWVGCVGVCWGGLGVWESW
jgi:hypothetical protein